MRVCGVCLCANVRLVSRELLRAHVAVAVVFRGAGWGGLHDAVCLPREMQREERQVKGLLAYARGKARPTLLCSVPTAVPQQRIHSHVCFCHSACAYGSVRSAIWPSMESSSSSWYLSLPRVMGGASAVPVATAMLPASEDRMASQTWHLGCAPAPVLGQSALC